MTAPMPTNALPAVQTPVLGRAAARDKAHPDHVMMRDAIAICRDQVIEAMRESRLIGAEIRDALQQAKRLSERAPLPPDRHTLSDDEVIEYLKTQESLRAKERADLLESARVKHLTRQEMGQTARRYHLALAYLRGREYREVERTVRRGNAPNTAKLWDVIRGVFPSTADAMRVCGSELPMSWVR